MRSLLVIRFSSLGDVLFAIPAVRALLDSGQEPVSWLVEDRASDLPMLVPGLHEVLVFPRRHPSEWFDHLSRLRERNDQVIVDFQCNLKSRAHRLFLDAGEVYGFDHTVAKEGGEKGLTCQVQPSATQTHRIDQNLALVKALGAPVPDVVPRPSLNLNQKTRDQATSWKESDPRPLVLLHPGTSAFGKLKRWSPSQFGGLGDLLVQQHQARIVITGGPGEEDIVRSTRHAMAELHQAIQANSVEELGALLEVADLVIAADSFPLHLANLLETPVVGLYGPKDPAVTGPYWDRAEVVRSEVSCSPCALRQCDDRICMDRLAIENVAEAATRLLSP